MSFCAPENYKEFYNIIYRKCLTFIQLGYWDNLTKKQLDTWLSNFREADEKYLAALILNKLIYRNEASILSMFSNLFYIEVPKYLKSKNVYTVNDLDYFRTKLYKSQENFFQIANFRFSTISTGDLGESGHLYIRYLREHFICNALIVDISSEKKPTPDDEQYKFENILPCIKTIIFIDDFIGSGEQIKEFILDNKEKLELFDNIVFMPLVAHQKGIDNVLEYSKELLLNIEVRPIEIMTYENSSFYLHEKDDTLFDGENTIDDLRTFYKDLFESKDFDISSEYGFGDLGLMHIFSTGVPDNNLPIIYKTNEAWHALKEKR